MVFETEAASIDDMTAQTEEISIPLPDGSPTRPKILVDRALSHSAGTMHTSICASARKPAHKSLGRSRQYRRVSICMSDHRYGNTLRHSPSLLSGLLQRRAEEDGDLPRHTNKTTH